MHHNVYMHSHTHTHAYTKIMTTYPRYLATTWPKLTPRGHSSLECRGGCIHSHTHTHTYAYIKIMATYPRYLAAMWPKSTPRGPHQPGVQGEAMQQVYAILRRARECTPSCRVLPCAVDQKWGIVHVYASGVDQKENLFVCMLVASEQKW
jgi:hypothetical protein